MAEPLLTMNPDGQNVQMSKSLSTHSEGGGDMALASRSLLLFQISSTVLSTPNMCRKLPISSLEPSSILVILSCTHNREHGSREKEAVARSREQETRRREQVGGSREKEAWSRERGAGPCSSLPAPRFLLPAPLQGQLTVTSVLILATLFWSLYFCPFRKETFRSCLHKYGDSDGDY